MTAPDLIFPWDASLRSAIDRASPVRSTGQALYLTTDASGQVGQTPYHVVACLATDFERTSYFTERVREVRREYRLKERRLSYKELRSDKLTSDALPHFLVAAELLSGCLLTVAYPRSLGLFYSRSPAISHDDEAELRSRWKDRDYESALRQAHVASYMLARVLSPRQPVDWISDEDSIVANRSRLEDVARIAGNFLNRYRPDYSGAKRMGTTAGDPSQHLFREDLCSVADIAAGAVSELLKSVSDGRTDNRLPKRVVFPWYELPERSQNTLNWLAGSGAALRRSLLVFGETPEVNVAELKMSLQPPVPPATSSR